MSNITKIKIDNEREHSYQDFPANREFKKRAEDDNPGGGGWPSDLPKPSVGGYGYTEDETIHQIDEKYIPESCRWPSDLPLPTSGGYGYTEESEEQKTVVTFTGTGDNIYIDDSAFSNPPIDWKVGDTLTITINGTIYKVPMRSDPMEQLGDEGMVGWDAGAPRNPDSYWDIDWSDYDFLLHISWYYGEFDGGYVKIKDGEGTYDISATVGGDTTVHKIDEKYLPASGNDPDLVFVINKHFDGELSKTDVSIATGTIADFVEKMENGNAKCVVRYHNVSEPGTAVTYGEITNVMVERYETGVYFYYLYAGGGYGISVVMIECNTNGTIVNVFKQDPGSSTN